MGIENVGEFTGVWLAQTAVQIDPDDVAACASAKLRVPAADVLPYAEAAIEYVQNWTGVDVLLNDDALLAEGLCLLTQRIYTDTAVPGGNSSSFDDFTSTFVPLSLGTHLRDYWDHIAVEWAFG
jgi:hypothetical protein